MNKKKRITIFLTIIMTFVAMSFVILPDKVSAADEYSNPVKTYKIGKKNYAKEFKNQPVDEKYVIVWIPKQRVKNKKLRIRTTEGWKIKSIKIEYPHGQGVSEKKLKNNKKFTVPKYAHKHFYLKAKLIHTKTGRVVTREIATIW